MRAAAAWRAVYVEYVMLAALMTDVMRMPSPIRAVSGQTRRSATRHQPQPECARRSVSIGSNGYSNLAVFRRTFANHAGATFTPPAANLPQRASRISCRSRVNNIMLFILIPGLILVALMVYASTRIKKSAAAAFNAETVESDDFIIQKPQGFLNKLNRDEQFAFEAYSKEFGVGEAADFRQGSINLTIRYQGTVDEAVAEMRRRCEYNRRPDRGYRLQVTCDRRRTQRKGASFSRHTNLPRRMANL